MSVLRLAHPGQPTTLLDLGPSVGRRSMSRLGIKGGSIYGVLPTGVSKPHSEDRRMGKHKARPK